MRLAPKVAADPNDTPAARRHGYFGDSYANGRGMIVRISTRKNRTTHQAVETLMHEWAHLRSRRERLKRPHGPLWWRESGRIYEHYMDRGGWERVCRYYKELA